MLIHRLARHSLIISLTALLAACGGDSSSPAAAPVADNASGGGSHPLDRTLPKSTPRFRALLMATKYSTASVMYWSMPKAFSTKAYLAITRLTPLLCWPQPAKCPQ